VVSPLLANVYLHRLDRAWRGAYGTLARYADAGMPIVGVEPSCTAVLRGEAGELLDDPATERVAQATRTLAELLTGTPGWTPPSLAGVEVVASSSSQRPLTSGRCRGSSPRRWWPPAWPPPATGCSGAGSTGTSVTRWC